MADFSAKDVFQMDAAKTVKFRNTVKELDIKEVVYSVMTQDIKGKVLRTLTFNVIGVNSFYITEDGMLVIELQPNSEVVKSEHTEEEAKKIRMEEKGFHVEEDGTLDLTPNRAKRRQLEKERNFVTRMRK